MESVCKTRHRGGGCRELTQSCNVIFIYLFFFIGGEEKLMFADVWHRRGGPDRGADGGCINNVKCNIPQTHLVQISHV